MIKLYEWIDRAWQWLAERVFVRFDFDLPADQLKHLAQDGRLTFCLTDGGIVEWLILSSWSRKHGLGAILVSNRKRILLFSKPLYFLQILFRRRSYADLFLLEKEDGPRLIFCPSREPKRPFDPTPSESVLADIFKKLAPTTFLKSFHFVPVLILWRKHARGAARRPVEYLLGLSSSPNILGKLWHLLRQHKDSTVRALSPLAMAAQTSDGFELLETSEAIRVAKTTRRKILVLTQQEMRIILGPRYGSPHIVKETILRDEELKDLITKIAEKENVDPRKVMQRAYKNLTEIVSNYKIRSVELFYLFLRWLFTRVFDGVIYSKEEIEEVRDVMRKKAVVFIPCHRSHFDYLVMPYVMFDNDIITPHIAAGINLSFWPIGSILRSSGAFFIRRSFRGDDLYALCLKKYIGHILHTRHPFKFFIEGTRSRSGKMLPPAYGLLKTVLERYQKNIVEDIALIPASITYDEVPEEGSYTQELGGRKKTKESTGALLKSRQVIKRKMGRVYLRFAPAISVKELVDHSEKEGDDFTRMLQKSAFQISKEISNVTPVTPKSIVSTILLNHQVSTLSLEEILRITNKLADFAEWAKIPLTVRGEGELKRSVEQTIRILKRRGVVGSAEDTIPRLYYCESSKRTLLTYYKNTAIHCYVQPAIALLALLKHLQYDNAFDSQKVLNYSLELRNLLKFDFFFSPSRSFKGEVRDTLAYLLSNEDWDKPGKNPVEFASKNFKKAQDSSVYIRGVGYLLESYLITLNSLKEITESEFEKKALIQSITRYAINIRERKELRFAESISIQNFTTALQLLENQGIIKMVKEPGRSRISIHKWSQKAETLQKSLEDYLELIELNPETVYQRKLPLLKQVDESANVVTDHPQG